MLQIIIAIHNTFHDISYAVLKYRKIIDSPKIKKIIE